MFHALVVHRIISKCLHIHRVLIKQKRKIWTKTGSTNWSGRWVLLSGWNCIQFSRRLGWECSGNWTLLWTMILIRCTILRCFDRAPSATDYFSLGLYAAGGPSSLLPSDFLTLLSNSVNILHCGIYSLLRVVFILYTSCILYYSYFRLYIFYIFSYIFTIVFVP